MVGQSILALRPARSISPREKNQAIGFLLAGKKFGFPMPLPHLPTATSKTHRMKSFIPLVLAVLSVHAASAQDRAEMERRLAALPDAPSVIDPAGLDAFKLNGAGASAKTVPVEGRPFSRAIQIRTGEIGIGEIRLECS